MFCGKDERGKGDDDDDDTSALLSAASSTVSAVGAIPAAAVGKAAVPVNAQLRGKATWNPANPPDANPLIGALTFETPTPAVAATPWSQTLANFPASPTISTPGMPTWFALSQVPIPAPVAAGPVLALAAAGKGRALEGSSEHQSADNCSDKTASKRPKLDIPDQGFHQVRGSRRCSMLSRTLLPLYFSIDDGLLALPETVCLLRSLKGQALSSLVCKCAVASNQLLSDRSFVRSHSI
jgi:hypothetical protein